MAEYIRPFEFKGSTANLTVTSTSQTVSIPAGVGTRTIRVANIGTQTIFINKGDSTVTATTTTSLPLLPNSVETFLIHPEDTTVAAIASATGSTVYVTVGEGA